MRPTPRSCGRLAAGLLAAQLLVPAEARAQRVEPAAASAYTGALPRLELGTLPPATAKAKSRLVAFGLGYLFPGAGHFYAGESWRGANIMGIVVGGFMLAGSTENESTAGNIALTSMVVYLWSMVDAPMAASRQNRRLRGQAPTTS